LQWGSDPGDRHNGDEQHQADEEVDDRGKYGSDRGQQPGKPDAGHQIGVLDQTLCPGVGCAGKKKPRGYSGQDEDGIRKAVA
jgi:hypothetical protein